MVIERVSRRSSVIAAYLFPMDVHGLSSLLAPCVDLYYRQNALEAKVLFDMQGNDEHDIVCDIHHGVIDAQWKLNVGHGKVKRDHVSGAQGGLTTRWTLKGRLMRLASTLKIHE